MRIVSVVLIVFAVAAGGCAKTRASMLSDRAEAYSRSLRWSNLSSASLCMADDVRRTLTEKVAQDLAKNQIVEYAIVDLGLDPQSLTGTVVVEYNFVNRAYQDLASRQEIQVWEYNQGKHDWFLRDLRSMTGPSSN